MSFLIRPATAVDYPAVSDLNTAVFGFYISPEDLQQEAESFPAHCKHHRWVAEVDRQVVATGWYFQLAGRYHPQKFKLEIFVHPEHRRLGIGGALYDVITQAIRRFNPIALNTSIREDHTDGVAFAERRGFTEAMRTWEQKLLLADFDPTTYAPTLDKVASLGYDLRYHTELAANLGHLEKLHALMMELRADVPAPEPISPIPFEHWVKHHAQNPDLWNFLVAVKDGEYVGVTSMTTTTEEEGMLHVGLTGVKRRHRGTGLAYALKVKSMADAREQGFKSLLTWNESNNQRMLAVNARLGFVKQPAWVDFNKALQG